MPSRNHRAIDTSPWERFTRWFQKLFLSSKPVYPKIIGEPAETKVCLLVEYERFEDGACYTWRAIPKYAVVPNDAHIFLLCDDLKGVPKKNKLATHRLTVAIASAKSKKAYWGGEQEGSREGEGDFEMTSDWGDNNCAWMVTRLLSRELLKMPYDKINWSAIASRYVEQHRHGKEIKIN